jgi:CheY-like chemotaxis protein
MLLDVAFNQSGEFLPMSKRIMLVDDEVVMLALLGIAMKRGGYTVIEAESPFMALDLLETGTPDLIIMDLMMPGIDGVELCSRIRSRPRTAQTPIIILSALTDPSNMKRASDAGANEYLSKLTPHRDVLDTVRRLLSTDSADQLAR